MKRTLALLLVLTTSVTLFYGADSTVFERTRARMQQALEKTGPDGSVKINKQFRRWEWFWQGRLTEDGSFPSPAHYQQELAKLQRAKSVENVQAPKTWKELGPTAPDLPGQSAQWNGIGRVNVVEFSRQNPNLVYAGAASGGLWKSTDGGSNWTAVNISIIPVVGVSDIAISAQDDKVIFVATGDADAAIFGDFTGYPSFTYGVIKSTDGGVTWAQTGLSYDPSQGSLVARLWLDPRDTSIVVAATYGGVMRSSNGGASWIRAQGGVFRDLIGNPANPDVLYSTTFSESGNAGIFRSTDNGVSWTQTRTIAEANRIRLAVTKANGNVVGAVASRAYRFNGDAEGNGLEGVYKSTDAGTSFEKLSTTLNLLHWNASGQGNGGQGFYDLAMEISPTNANHIFVGGINVWRTTTNGNTWILSAHWTGDGAPWVHADHHYFKFHPTQNKLFAAHDGGIARSTDQGISWRDASNGLRIQQYYGLATSNINPSITISGSQDNGTALSKNNGSTFVHSLDGDGMMAAIDYIDPQLLYGSQYNGTFFRSTNQGNNWIFSSSRQQRGESMAAWVSPIAADPTNQNVAYIGYSQVYKTTTGGSFWTRISNNPTSVPCRWIAVAPSDSRHIYAAYNTALWYTTDGGTNWTQQTGISGVIMGVEVHPTDPKKIFIAIGGYSGGQKVLQVSNGTVTNVTGTGLPNVPCNSVVYQRGTTNRLYAGTDLGVFFSDEGSGFWQPYGTGMPAALISAMRLIPTSNILRVSTYGRGIWEIDVRQCTATTPTITKVTPTTACVGDSVVLEASTGYASYRWSSGDTTRRVVFRSIAQTGSYTVSVEDNSGCRATSAPTSITFLASPSKPLVSQRGKDTLRSSAVGGITKFQWARDGVDIPGATLRDHVTQISGVYTVRVENNQNCTSTSNSYTFTYDPMSVEEDVAAGRAIGISPNPSSDVAMITMPVVASRTLDVISITGQLVYSMPVADGANEYRLDLASIARGTYIVRLTAGSSVWMARLLRD
ncbi:MAG: T9SS type A sorting domain-containing protein [Ignavibacteria bacterium]|nr:T9SS type A sorting domain-containing protein [Ignavibacteria bacterium]